MQHFSDDEEEADLPLAPLPDVEQDGNEGDDDLEQDTSVAPDSASRAVSEPVTAPPETEDATPAPQPPKPHPLSMSMVPDSPTADDLAAGAGVDTGSGACEGAVVL